MLGFCKITTHYVSMRRGGGMNGYLSLSLSRCNGVAGAAKKSIDGNVG